MTASSSASAAGSDSGSRTTDTLHALEEGTANAARRIVATYAEDFFDFATLSSMLGVSIEGLRYRLVEAEYQEAQQAAKKTTKKSTKKTTKKAAAKKSTTKKTAAKKTTKKAAAKKSTAKKTTTKKTTAKKTTKKAAAKKTA